MRPASALGVMIALCASAVSCATATDPHPPEMGTVVAMNFPAAPRWQTSIVRLSEQATTIDCVPSPVRSPTATLIGPRQFPEGSGEAVQWPGSALAARVSCRYQCFAFIENPADFAFVIWLQLAD
jgi:hypothetical protein